MKPIKSTADLFKIKYTRLIEDPFPDHTRYETFIKDERSVTNFFLCLFRIKPKLKRPTQISIHEAYRLGYEKAYSEIAETLPKVDLFFGMPIKVDPSLPPNYFRLEHGFDNGLSVSSQIMDLVHRECFLLNGVKP